MACVIKDSEFLDRLSQTAGVPPALPGQVRMSDVWDTVRSPKPERI
jgi:hypothetical protein